MIFYIHEFALQELNYSSGRDKYVVTIVCTAIDKLGLFDLYQQCNGRRQQGISFNIYTYLTLLLIRF